MDEARVLMQVNRSSRDFDYEGEVLGVYSTKDKAVLAGFEKFSSLGPVQLVKGRYFKHEGVTVGYVSIAVSVDGEGFKPARSLWPVIVKDGAA